MSIMWEKPSRSFSPCVYSGNTSTIPSAPCAPLGCMGVPLGFLNGECIIPMTLYFIHWLSFVMVADLH